MKIAPGIHRIGGNSMINAYLVEQAGRDVESDIRSWCRSPLRTLLEAAAAGRYADAADR